MYLFLCCKSCLIVEKEWGGNKWYVNKLYSQLYLQVSPLALLEDIPVLSIVHHSPMCGNLSLQSELSFVSTERTVQLLEPVSCFCAGVTVETENSGIF